MQVAAKAQENKASLQDALAAAQSRVAEASATYVQLLALAQLGLANQLPAGNERSHGPRRLVPVQDLGDTLTPCREARTVAAPGERTRGSRTLDAVLPGLGYRKDLMVAP